MKKLITYLVEDNVVILENLIETLQEIAEVRVVAHSATQAEADHWLAAHDGSWNMAIVDLQLESGTGLGVLAGCQNRHPYQKIVVLTNYATSEVRLRAEELGADRVFDKSTELDELLAYCAEQVGHLQHEDVQKAQGEAMSRSAAAGDVEA